MASTPLKDARVEFRVTADQKQTIEAAAAIQGRTVTDFSADVLVERAQEVIQTERQLRIEASRFDTFSRLMDEPPRAIGELRELMTRKPVFVD
ncbi:DUF1778 domain-containing protein [Microbacterium sp.]|uniref:type II toxin-antitoxin system TacA family antitoxin n=1 Tax=Microbacterium sp. TaxID=51671 RepID=UPI003563572E